MFIDLGDLVIVGRMSDQSKEGGRVSGCNIKDYQYGLRSSVRKFTCPPSDSCSSLSRITSHYDLSHRRNTVQ